jgi:2-oxoglutarate dehydrogenase E1 component
VIGEQDPIVQPAAVKRVVICSGHVYYTLRQYQIDNKLKTPVAFVRLEQFAPFPFSHLAAELSKYPNAELLFAQEEPKNMGAWSYSEPRLRATIGRVDQDRKTPRAFR